MSTNTSTTSQSAPQFKWSIKQRLLIETAYHGETLVLAGGATRSGKSASAIEAFLRYILNSPSVRHHAIVGWSSGIIFRNILPAFLETAGSYGWKPYIRRQDGYMNLNGSRIWLLGGTDSQARKRVQGATFGGILIDEATNITSEFFWWLYTRLSYPDSRVWLTYNPEQPNHWLNQEIIRNEDLDKRTFHFDLDDNPGLSHEVHDRLRRLPEVYRKRLVSGEWTARTGLVFPYWRADLHSFPSPPSYSMAIDFGANFAILVFAQHENRINVLSEFKEYLPAATPADLIKIIKAQHPGARISVLYVDPSTPPAFKNLLRKEGYRVINAMNDINEGIVRTQLALTDQARINIKCGKLIAELNHYLWDEKDRPVKKNDHLVDALRYRLARIGGINVLSARNADHDRARRLVQGYRRSNPYRRS